MKVLIVDDSRSTREIIKKILKAIGYEVLEAEDGEKALKILYEGYNAPDLILLDWNMPGMNGYEFLKRVRKDPKWQDIKIIMVTTENQQDSIIKALKAGADEYLMKPFDGDMLTTKIDMLMEEV
ncbi:MAG: response regulator [Deltaproteobacteria bacterium]|nr:MAG: response regulator [Deltaproteobacteria bacterium]